MFRSCWTLHDTGSGILTVGAAGNEDSMIYQYPAAFSDAIAVAAVDDSGRKTDYSNFGRWVDVAAPGGFGGTSTAIYSTAPGSSSLVPDMGTSMATPVVAGTAALVLAAQPNMIIDFLRPAITDTADPSIYDSNSNGGFNYTYYFPKPVDEDFRQPLLGSGQVNAAAAVQNSRSSSLPVIAGLDRVTAQCGAIKGIDSFSTSWNLWLVLLFPVLLLSQLFIFPHVFQKLKFFQKRDDLTS